jgi:hypothetical protein
MTMKYEIIKLIENISENIDYLSSKYDPTEDILYELTRMINLNMSNSMMFQWYAENEESINKINSLLDELKIKI